MNINTMPKAIYDCSIEAEKIYTGYRWSLKDWSLLSTHYQAGIKSSEFALTNMTGNKCALELKYTASVYDDYARVTRAAFHTLQVEFLNKIEYKTMQVSASFLSDKGEKLKTYTRTYQSSVLKGVIVELKDSLGEAAVAQYLKKDTLILFVELTIATAIKTSVLQTNVWNVGFNADVREQLNAIFDSKDLCDVTFKVGEKKLRAHRLILAANSEVFRAMFTTDMKEQAEDTIEIIDTDAAAFEAFLRFMYTGRVDDPDKVVENLLAIADKYRVMALVKLCEKCMLDTLNKNTAIDYLLVAHQRALPQLEELAVNFVRANSHVLGNADVLAKLVDYPDLISKVFNKD